MNALKILIVLVVVGTFGSATNAQQVRPDSASKPGRTIYSVVQQQPEFPGGMASLGKYIQKNLRYPTGLTAEPEAGGRVFVSFIVGEEGRIEEAKVLKSLGPKFDEEAIRLITSMPNWIPGKIDGRAVACRYNLPINFSAVRNR
ncbi:energy transducer TonB [Spirosoma sp.]|uniref:energy transducer TonB n=1 Tax=Spirosoma sp. TaxID=1899569 RepID=UPI003B3A6F39